MDKDEELKRLRKENDTLRALLGNSAKPCVYCGLPAEDQAKCPSGFPGCSRADDQMLSQHFAAGYAAEQSEKELRLIKALLREIKAQYDADGTYRITEHMHLLNKVFSDNYQDDPELLALLNKPDNLV